MLVVCRALMARPKLLILDEPSLGLAPLAVRDIAHLITSVNRDYKVSVILVEQNSRLALRISSTPTFWKPDAWHWKARVARRQ